MRLYALHDYCEVRKKSGCFKVEKLQASKLNDENYGIFWTPNDFFEGIRQEAKLKRLNYWFIDYDKGCKDYMIATIENFPLIPSLLVETKRGFHVYWACAEDLATEKRVDEYKSILERLVSHFDADENAMGVTRILRAPGYFHCKDSKNRFLIKDIWACDKKYTCQEISNAIDSLGNKVIRVVNESNEDKFFRSVPKDDFWAKVYTLDCFFCLPLISGQPECLGETFRVERVGSKGKIYVNDKLIDSCWIDESGHIGSHANGGPTLANWIRWYGDNSWDDAATVLKRCIPELNEVFLLPPGFE